MKKQSMIFCAVVLSIMQVASWSAAQTDILQARMNALTQALRRNPGLFLDNPVAASASTGKIEITQNAVTIHQKSGAVQTILTGETIEGSGISIKPIGDKFYLVYEALAPKDATLDDSVREGGIFTNPEIYSALNAVVLEQQDNQNRREYYERMGRRGLTAPL